MHISYKAILKSALGIAWKNKILWLFGIFASFLSFEGVYEILISQINQARSREILYNSVLNLYSNQKLFINKSIYFLNLLSGDYGTYLLFVLAGALVALFLWLAFVSQIFIIKSSFLFYKNRKVLNGKIFYASTNKFWPVLGINILTKLFLYAGFIAFSLPLFYSLFVQNQTAIIASDVFFFILFTLLAISVGFLTAYAINFIVLRDLSIIEAIKESWQLFSKNITISLEIAFILFLLKIVSLIVIFSLFLLSLGPLAILLFVSLSSNSPLGFALTLALSILIFTLISILINSIFTAFYLASWTITFIKLTEEKLFGKITGFIKRIPAVFKKSAKNEKNRELVASQKSKRTKINTKKISKK